MYFCCEYPLVFYFVNGTFMNKIELENDVVDKILPLILKKLAYKYPKSKAKFIANITKLYYQSNKKYGTHNPTSF